MSFDTLNFDVFTEDNGVFFTDASQLGLAPGEWPDKITLDSEKKGLDDKLWIIERKSDMGQGDGFYGCIYEIEKNAGKVLPQFKGKEFKIFND